MVQDRNLPEGTDKIVSGASATGSRAGTGTTGTATGQPDSPAIGGGTSSGATAGGSTGTGPGSRTTPTTGAGGTSGSGSAQTGGGLSREAIADKVRTGKEKLSGEAAGRARGLVGQGLERGGDALANVSRLIDDTAGGLDERLGQEYGDYARRAAQSIESAAQSIRSKDPDELIDDTRNFVRKSPGVALAGAAIVGFALARLVKSGLDAASGDDRADRNSGGEDSGRGGTA